MATAGRGIYDLQQKYDRQISKRWNICHTTYKSDRGELYFIKSNK